MVHSNINLLIGSFLNQAVKKLNKIPKILKIISEKMTKN
jgi:hypothetical protein